MKYSDVVNAGLILPRKDNYTVRDVNRVYKNATHEGNSLTYAQAVFIVKCSAAYYDTDWSKTVANMSGDGKLDGMKL